MQYQKDNYLEIETDPVKQLEMARLYRQVEGNQQVYITLKQQLETTKIEEVKESDYVVILDPPEVPLIRFKPNKRNMVIFAGILGIGIGLFFAFIKELSLNTDNEQKNKINKSKYLFKKNISELLSGRLK